LKTVFSQNLSDESYLALAIPAVKFEIERSIWKEIKMREWFKVICWCDNKETYVLECKTLSQQKCSPFSCSQLKVRSKHSEKLGMLSIQNGMINGKVCEKN